MVGQIKRYRVRAGRTEKKTLLKKPTDIGLLKLLQHIIALKHRVISLSNDKHPHECKRLWAEVVVRAVSLG